MTGISPFLWFNDQAEEAVNLYVSIFPNSTIGETKRYGPNQPGAENKVMVISFKLAGQRFTALNGGPRFKFTEAISFVIDCEDQAEIDHYWNALTADGGAESQCGWLKDKFGLFWQVVPRELGRLLRTPAAMQAMMSMKKLDIAALEAAASSS